MKKIRDAAAATKPGEWVLAYGYDSTILPGGKIPTLAELDALVPNGPFWMVESNGHVAYANSKGLAAVGITEDSKDPPTGRYIRDARGNLTGRTEEPPTFAPFLSAIPRPSEEKFLGYTRDLFAQAVSLGLTAVQDLSVGLNAGTRDVEDTKRALGNAPIIRYRGTLVSTLANE